MVELKIGLRTIDLPFIVRVPNVTEEMFDELVDEDTKAELLDGVMIVRSPASPHHNLIAGFLRRLISDYVEETDLGAVFGPDDLIHLATCRKFAPDVFFLRKGRVPCPVPEKEFEGSPDLVIEVLSPSNREDDLEDKRPAYQEAGVKEIWFVDPEEKQVLMDRRRKKGYTSNTVTSGRINSAVVKGFWVDVEWLWTQPLPKVLICLRQILK